MKNLFSIGAITAVTLVGQVQRLQSFRPTN